jgi:hypothetical protein
MLKTFNYYDITNLHKNPKKEKFLFDGIAYNTFFFRDTNILLIHSFKSGNAPIKLSSFIYSLNNHLGIENKTIKKVKTITKPLPSYCADETVDKLKSIKNLSKEFLETMQLSDLFLSDYKNHENIKYYDDTHEVLYYTNGSQHNARFKFNGKSIYKGWSTFKRESGFESIGAYLKGANDKSATLVLVEGLKDAINANIALPQCDILATDSKNIKFLFSLLDREYKTVIYFQDRELTPTEIINTLGELKGEDRKILNKMYYVNYNKLPSGIKDITDFFQALSFTAKKLKRSALSQIKKVLQEERVKQLENAIEIDKKINPLIENAKKFNNLPLFKELVQKKLKLKGDITEDIKYYIKEQVTPPSNHTKINLSSSKFLGKITTKIISEFSQHSKIILGSPTGTGKSTFTKESLTKHYKNMIIIAPLKKVASELSETDKASITYVENNEKNMDYVLANINAPYVSITTDTLYNLLNNKKTEEELKERLAKCELIVFDEQHIVHQSHNFRGKVVWMNDYLRDNYNGKVLSMSGTPIYNDLPTYHPILCELDRRYISAIDYFLDPFENEAQIIENIKEELKNGNVLLYSKSRKTAHYIQRYLIENNINTLLVTSRGNIKKITGEAEIEIDDNGINAIDENIAIISTTRATTGANFKNLSVIYQFGSAYDPHTFIQLMARIRGDGKYYFIKTGGDKAQDESLMNKAINILNTAKKFNLKKASDLFLDATKKKYIEKNIELPYQEHNLKAFLSTYRRALGMIASEGMGKETQDKEDFEFTNRLDEIEEGTFNNVFKNGDSAEFTKYIEREMIDFLQRKGDVEILNNSYNLSFEIFYNNKELDYQDIDSKLFITLDDAKEKEVIKDEKKEKLDRFKNEIVLKFDWLLNPKNQSEFFKTFGSGELAKLLSDIRLDNLENQDKILGNKQTNKAKFTRLKFFLIPKKIIISKIFNAIKIKEFITINELSTVLEQEVYLTMKTAKSPFSQFIKDFLEDEKITKDGLEFYARKKINSKESFGVITLPKVKLQELKKIKNKEEREVARIAELNRIETEKFNAVYPNIEYIIEPI